MTPVQPPFPAGRTRQTDVVESLDGDRMGVQHLLQQFPAQVVEREGRSRMHRGPDQDRKHTVLVGYVTIVIENSDAGQEGLPV